jgi:hypothetical protein
LPGPPPPAPPHNKMILTAKNIDQQSVSPVFFQTNCETKQKQEIQISLAASSLFKK